MSHGYAVIAIVSASLAFRGYPRGLRYAFWPVTSFVFLNLGFNSIHQPGGLSESVSPVIVSLLKNAFALSTIYSFDYRSLNVCIREMLAVQGEGPQDSYIAISGLVFVINHFYRLLYTSVHHGEYGFLIQFFLPSVFLIALIALYGSPETTVPTWLCRVVHFAIKQLLLVYAQTSEFKLVLWFLVSAQLCQPFRAKPEPEEGNRSSPNTRTTPEARKNKWWKFVEFVIGTLGTVLFQYFFQLKSFDHIITFLYFAVVWLGNVALLRPATDFGVFNFLLGNVIVGSTVNRFGLGGKTWLAYGVCVVLYLVRLLVDQTISVSPAQVLNSLRHGVVIGFGRLPPHVLRALSNVPV